MAKVVLTSEENALWLKIIKGAPLYRADGRLFPDGQPRSFIVDTVGRHDISEMAADHLCAQSEMAIEDQSAAATWRHRSHIGKPTPALAEMIAKQSARTEQAIAEMTKAVMNPPRFDSGFDPKTGRYSAEAVQRAQMGIYHKR